MLGVGWPGAAVNAVTDSPEIVAMPAEARPVVRRRITMGDARWFAVADSPLEMVKLAALGVECTAWGAVGGIGVYRSTLAWRMDFTRDHRSSTSIPFGNIGELSELLAKWWPKMEEEA